MPIPNDLSPVLALALTIHAEAGGEPLRAKEYVADSILNRSEYHNQTLVDVVSAHKQYSCWNNTEKGAAKTLKLLDDPKVINSPEWQDSMNLAKQLYRGEYEQSSDVTHYYNPKTANPKDMAAIKHDTTLVDKFGKQVYRTFLTEDMKLKREN